MKKTLLIAGLILATLSQVSADCGCAANDPCDEEKFDLTGAWLGAGVIVDFDKYEADVHFAKEYKDIADQVRIAKASESGDAAAYGEDNQPTPAQLSEILSFMQKGDEIEKDIKWGNTNDFIKAKSEIKETNDLPSPNTYYAHKLANIKKSKTVAGGELKGSFYYNVENGLVVGFDLSLGLTARGKKCVDIDTKFGTEEYTPDSKVYYFDADSENGIKAGQKGEELTIETAADKLKQNTVLANYSYGKTAVENVNDYVTCESLGATLVSNDTSSVEFKKDVFSPTAAFVIGGYFKGFFAGLRLGANYMTGRINNSDGEQKVRQVAPVLGLQLMKHIKKGVFAYLTYDHMFGCKKIYLRNSSIKSFKRNQDRISLGLGYQFKTNH